MVDSFYGILLFASLLIAGVCCLLHGNKYQRICWLVLAFYLIASFAIQDLTSPAKAIQLSIVFSSITAYLINLVASNSRELRYLAISLAIILIAVCDAVQYYYQLDAVGFYYQSFSNGVFHLCVLSLAAWTLRKPYTH